MTQAIGLIVLFIGFVMLFVAAIVLGTVVAVMFLINVCVAFYEYRKPEGESE